MKRGTNLSKTVAVAAIASLAVVLFVGDVTNGSDVPGGSDDGGWCHIRSSLELTVFGTGRPYTSNDIGRPVFVARWIGDQRISDEIREYSGEWKGCENLPRKRATTSDRVTDGGGTNGGGITDERTSPIVVTVVAGSEAEPVVTRSEASCYDDDQVHYKWITCPRSNWTEGSYPWD